MAETGRMEKIGQIFCSDTLKTAGKLFSNHPKNWNFKLSKG